MTGSIHFVVLWIGKIDNAPPNFRARRLEPIRAADQEQTVAESEIQLAFRLVLKRLDASLAGDVAPARGAAADLHLAGHDDVEPAAGFAFGENGAATGEVSSLGPPGQRPGRAVFDASKGRSPTEQRGHCQVERSGRGRQSHDAGTQPRQARRPRRVAQGGLGPAYAKETHYLRVYLAQLRRKLEDDPSHPKHLLTEAGMGYRFEP